MFRALYRAQKGECFYCGKKMLSKDGHGDDLTLDHFIPLSKGGTNHHTNYVLACRSCNLEKADQLPNSKDWIKKYSLKKYILQHRKNIFKMNFSEKTN